MESTSYVLSFRMVFFYLVTTGWIFDISLLCENSIKSIKQSPNVSKIGALRPFLGNKIRRPSKWRPIVRDAWRAGLTLDTVWGGGGRTEVVVVVVASLSVIWILQPKFLI